ncbi:hypothetical protein COCOBI_02-7660 [Coccomyxa sp. Obi]|nr:hypothetical protein COCOBI_02-7660 [Coccomyxa sp. Obi]
MEYAPLRKSRNTSLTFAPPSDAPMTDIAGRISPRNAKKDGAGILPSTHVQKAVRNLESQSNDFAEQSSLEIRFTRPSVHKSTLNELAAASPSKHPASLEQQLAELQHDLKAKQAEVDAGRADLEYRQQLLQFAAGAARREVLELRAYKDKADAALALAEKRIEELQQEVNAVTAKLKGSTLASGKEDDSGANTPSMPTSVVGGAAEERSQSPESQHAQLSQESQPPAESLEGHVPVTAEAGQQLAELEAQLEAEAGLKLQLLERVHHLESQVAAKEEQCAGLEAELSALAAAATKAQERVRVLEPEVSALAAQAEQAGLELAEAAKEKAVLEEQCAQLRLQAQAEGRQDALSEQHADAAAQAALLIQRTAELQAAEQRSQDAAVEVQTLLATVARHKEEIEELKGSLAEVEKQVDGERGAHAALWEKLQQANERLSASATEALGKENEFERRLGMSDYRRQCSEAQLREALSSLKGVQVLGLATSLAMTGKVAQAQASQKGLAMAVGGLTEEMLAVEQELRLFATSEDSISTEVFWADSPDSSHAKGSNWQLATESEGHSSTHSAQLGAHQHVFQTPAAKPARNEQTSASSCSSISFTKGVSEQGKRDLEVSSVPCRQAPRVHPAAAAARMWLHGQISPPRQQLPSHLRTAWLPALTPGPLLLPSGQDDTGPTPRLHLRQDEHSQAMMASSENPMLLLETPQGPSGRQRGWNPEPGDLSALPRHASSCPATPQDTLHRCMGYSPVREAFPLTGARSQQPKAGTCGPNRREVFQRAAALADTLEQLRLQVQNSLAQPDATGLIAGSTGGCTAGRLLHTIDEAVDDGGSTGRASAASSVAPRHASSDEDSQDGVGAVGRGRLCGGLRLSSIGLVKGIGVPLPRQTSPDTSAARSASISAGPDLSSLPPRLQKIAQAALPSTSVAILAESASSPLDEASGKVVAPAPMLAVDEKQTSASSKPGGHKEKSTKKRHGRLRQIAGSLVAIPLLALAVVASPGLGHWLKPNSTLGSTRGMQGSKRLLIEAGSRDGLKQHVEMDMRHRGSVFG